MIIRKCLDEYFELLNLQGHPLPEILPAGLSREVIRGKMDDLKLKIPETIYELFEWRNGLKYSDEKRPYLSKSFGLLEEFYSLDDCISDYYGGIKHNGLDRNYFPVFSNSGGDMWYIDLTEGDKSKVYIFSPPLIHTMDLVSMYDSMEIMLVSFIKAYKEGIFSYKGDLIIDSDNYARFFKKLNPESVYWKDKALNE